MTRIPLTTLTLVSAAMLVANALPNAVMKTEVIEVPVPAPKPLMFVDCNLPTVEYARVCQGRARSEKTKARKQL